jgi:phage terminase large subunit-like protein
MISDPDADNLDDASTPPPQPSLHYAWIGEFPPLAPCEKRKGISEAERALEKVAFTPLTSLSVLNKFNFELADIVCVCVCVGLKSFNRE